MPEPHLRASDSDRAAAAAALGSHLSDGRLAVEEYDERLAKVYAARTYGELDEVFTDLPRRPSVGPTGVAPAPASACAGGWSSGRRHHVRASWAGWFTTAVIVTTIWLLSGISGGFPSFWPIWVIVPWAVLLLGRTVTGRSRPRGPGPRG